ncbi:hypothetical protein CT0861_09357 [Colletotrichum tofieldiae]|uniref:Uncharacterized protein n=1 Tax=Colletotrichum tofieldiae TaxID=708197 RepID=A0A166RLZ6_9PEZI|nr:hypothetical protein CT0861_09357 [Colletotrichum tofieldiae]
MTAFVTWGYNFASSPPPPPIATAAEPKTTSTQAQSPRKHFYMPRWLFLTVKVVLALAVVGLCVTGIIMLTDFFEVRKGHEGIIPRPAYLVGEVNAGQPNHGIGVYDSGGNKHHGTVQPEEWCKKHPGTCHWAGSQARGRIMNPKTLSNSSRVLLPGLCALIPEWIILVNVNPDSTFILASRCGIRDG